MKTHQRTKYGSRGTRLIGWNRCVLLTVVLLTYCAARADSDGFVKDSDRLYRTYLAGNREQAKRSLQETVVLIENAKLDKAAEAECFLFAYCRLFVLEKRRGDPASAEILWVKVRYWYLRHRELSGNTGEELLEALKGFIEEKCVAFVDKWDEGHNAGKAPNYVQQTAKQETPPR